MSDAPWPALVAALPPDLRADLRPGATAADLAAAADALGRPLGDAAALYAVHDGQAGDAPGVVVGLRVLPLADALAERARWLDTLATTPEVAGEARVRSVPPGAARPVYWSDGWLLVADDGAGNGLALDLDPGPAGAAGQVITVGPDEPDRRVVARSLGALLGWLAGAYAAGRVVRQRGDLVLANAGSRGFLDAAADVPDLPV